MAKRSELAQIDWENLSVLRVVSRVGVNRAASCLGVSTETFSEIELGQSPISLIDLRALSNLYRKPLSSFYLSHSTLSEEFGNTILNLRSIGNLDSGEDLTESAIDEWNKLLERRAALRTLLERGEVLPFRPPLKLNGATAAKMGITIREWLNIDYPLPIDCSDEYAAFHYFRDLVESKNLWVLQTDGVHIDDFRGAASSDPELPIVLINMADHSKARNFTLFHEIAHILRKEMAICNLNSYYNIESGGRKEEAFCDAVAAEVLMPLSLFKNNRLVQDGANTGFDLRMIKAIGNQFGASMHSTIIRLKEIGVFNVDEANYFINQLISLPKKKNEGGSYYTTTSARLGRKFPITVFSALDKGIISKSSACSMLNVKSNNILKLRNHMGLGAMRGTA